MCISSRFGGKEALDYNSGTTSPGSLGCTGNGRTGIWHDHPCRLWRHSVAARRLVPRPRVGDAPTGRGRTAIRQSDSATASAYQGTNTRAQPTLCRYGQVIPAGPRQCRGGIYPLTADRDKSLLTLINRSRLFFEDLPEIHRRREERAHNEIFNKDTRGTRPRYYLQNFHFQSGGWLTDESAERYDTQVEVLLKGTSNAMRRQALPPLHEKFIGRDQRQLRLLDIGSGTGRFVDFVKQAWPRLHVVGLDMSDAYVRHAKRHLRHRPRTSFVVGKAEAIPLPDNSQDAVTSIFLFHELPPKVRRSALHECARVLKPGGRLILLDSLQRDDRPDYDGRLRLFPQNYHEPYYPSYTKEDFRALAGERGLTHVRSMVAFVSKVMVFDKA